MQTLVLIAALAQCPGGVCPTRPAYAAPVAYRQPVAYYAAAPVAYYTPAYYYVYPTAPPAAHPVYARARPVAYYAAPARCMTGSCPVR